ncbi:DUF4190 domain-containing protein [Kitasatospora sp. NPDC059160]|uniref:DUF4190 domain-containing protein n=1 Tax=Kitasatospora sp. NPDC059160 TaxID=3346748 RepID=UPI00367AB5DA
MTVPVPPDSPQPGAAPAGADPGTPLTPGQGEAPEQADTQSEALSEAQVDAQGEAKGPAAEPAPADAEAAVDVVPLAEAATPAPADAVSLAKAAEPAPADAEAKAEAEAEAEGPAAEPDSAPVPADAAPAAPVAPVPVGAPAAVGGPSPFAPPEAAPTPPPAPAAYPAAYPAPGQGPAGAPGAYPGAPYWQGYPVVPPQPRNGLGTAGMVLGIVGTVLGLVVVLFWLSWLPALLALIFGIIGLGYVRKGEATNRGVALAGVILGVTGLLLSVGGGVVFAVALNSVQEDEKAEAHAARLRSEADDRAAADRAAKAKERLDAAKKKFEEEQQARAADEKARHLGFGQSYTYADGLKVTMAAPQPYVPNETVFPAPKNSTIIQIRITVTNTGSKDVSLVGSGLPTVKDANGGLVTALIDGSGRMKFIGDSLAPGAEATGVSAYALPNAAADPFSVQFTYYGSGQGMKSVTWTGSPN